MSRIFLINVGANTSHQSQARCPIRSDGTFIYVPFPYSESAFGTRPYPADAWRFTNGLNRYQTHADPDWKNLTYGDYVLNARAAALRSASPNDTLENGNIVFIGDRKTSALFSRAVPLVTKLTSSSLLYRVFRTATGDKLPLKGKHWSSYTRSCRSICDLDTHDGLQRGTILRDAIQERNHTFDLLDGL